MSETPATPALPATPGQTIGPFFGYALPYDKGELLVPLGHPQAVRLHGTVTDGHGDVIPDAMIEIWQADAQGNVVQETGSLIRDGHTFTGWGRTGTDNVGGYSFTTVEPGVVTPGSARYFSVAIFARGLLDKLHTRVYLPEDSDALAQDSLLSSLSETERATLVATREPSGALRWDVHLQGENETVFLDYWASTSGGEVS